MRRRGRPILGAFAGFFFFLSLSLLALVFGIVDLGSIVLGILPIVGIFVGIAVGLAAPFGKATAGA